MFLMSSDISSIPFNIAIDITSFDCCWNKIVNTQINKSTFYSNNPIHDCVHVSTSVPCNNLNKKWIGAYNIPICMLYLLFFNIIVHKLFVINDTIYVNLFVRL